MTNRQDCRFARPKVALSGVGYTDVPHEIERFEEHVGGAVQVKGF